MATQTQLMSALANLCEEQWSIIQTLTAHFTHSPKNTALRMISHDSSVSPEANSVSPRQLFFSIWFYWMEEIIWNNDLGSDLYSTQVQWQINCSIKPRLKIPSKTTEPEDISRNREWKFTNLICFAVPGKHGQICNLWNRPIQGIDAIL